MTFLKKQFRNNVNTAASCDFPRRFKTTGELCEYSGKYKGHWQPKFLLLHLKEHEKKSRLAV
jgi:hypothetical protein